MESRETLREDKGICESGGETEGEEEELGPPSPRGCLTEGLVVEVVALSSSLLGGVDAGVLTARSCCVVGLRYVHGALLTERST